MKGHQLAFSDPLVSALPAGSSPDFFDRFYFNLHGAEPTPFLMVGGGVYPGRAVVDAYVIAVHEKAQRNLRLSTEYLGAPPNGVGPLTWRTVEPMTSWQLQLGPNPIGIEFDLVWTARSEAWRTDDVHLDDGKGGLSSFAHLFQPGTYEGTLTIDDQQHDVQGWLGQRDRSRGVRVMGGGAVALHLWVQAQLPDRTVSFSYDENREHEIISCDGAVLGTDGSVDPISAVRHAVAFDEGLDVTEAEVEVTTRSGERLRLLVDASAGGGFLVGGGYGSGGHGTPRGRDWSEHDTYPLDGSVRPRDLVLAITDRPARFRSSDGEIGSGVFEFAHSRSARYQYRPSLSDAQA